MMFCESPSWHGPERRRHCVLITQHTEYHLRSDVVVAVRAESGRFDLTHPALGAKVFREHVRLGERLWLFADDGATLVTSALRGITRPDVAVVRSYPGAQPTAPGTTAGAWTLGR